MGYAASRAAWAEAARPVLEQAAGRYRALVTYKQLSAAVQAATGITTTRPPATWVGDVLARVAAECQSRGEPLLSSLCVNLQGSVGAAYAEAVEHARGEAPADPDEQAATERLECYRHWEATGLPADGGTPLRTSHVPVTPRKAATTRAPRASTSTSSRTSTPRKAAAAKPAAPEPAPPRLCPRCFTVVPASGICDYCD